MHRGPHGRRLIALTALAAALFLLTASVAVARSTGGAHQRGRLARLGAPVARIGLGDARAIDAGHCAGTRQIWQSRRVRRRGFAGTRCRPAPAIAEQLEQPLYWGATIGDQMTGTQAPWDMSAVSRFESLAQKQASLVQFFQPFAECGSTCSFDYFPTTPMESIRQHGSIPVLSWSSQSTPSTVEEPDYQLADVAEGHFDEFLRRFATEAREWGHPFFIRFNWEMNGDWFPWGEGANGNDAGQYVAAWRHVHDIFSGVGATNVTWVWCPFVDPAGSLAPLASLYPGESYVDWVGLDGYNWGTNPASPRGWRSFDQLFKGSYDELTDIAPGKPVMIAEVGSSEVGGSKSAWIREALAAVPSEYPKVKALLWFDKYDDGMDWPIETSPAATVAFAEGIQDSAYVGASYAGLAGGPIQPPS